MWVRNSIHFGRCKQKQRVLRGLLCRCPSITEWEMHITAQGPRLRNDLYCVEWDVKLYYTIPYHFATASLITTQNVVAVCHYREGVCRRCKNWTLELDVPKTVGLEKTGAMPLRDGGNGLQWRRSVVKYGSQG